MIASLIITCIGIALVISKGNGSKKFLQIAAGIFIIGLALPCLIQISSTLLADANTFGLNSSPLGDIWPIFAVVTILALIGRFAMQQWIYAEPPPPIPTSIKKRIDLPNLEAHRSIGFNKGRQL